MTSANKKAPSEFAGVIIQGTVGYNYVIQGSTDLSSTNSWVTLTNITLTAPVQI